MEDTKLEVTDLLDRNLSDVNLGRVVLHCVDFIDLRKTNLINTLLNDEILPEWNNRSPGGRPH